MHVHIENSRESYPSQMLFHTLPLLFATDKARTSSFVLSQEAVIHPSSSTFSFPSSKMLPLCKAPPLQPLASLARWLP